MGRASLVLAAAVAVAGCGVEARRSTPAGDEPGGPVAEGPVEVERSAPEAPRRVRKQGLDPLERLPALQALRDELTAAFDARLEDSEAYVRDAPVACRGFPEGDLFPFTLPAMAYSQLGLFEPGEAEARLARVPRLLDAAVESAARKVGTAPSELVRLPSYRRHGCYLGQLALALATYRLAGGDGRYDLLLGHLADLLGEALLEARGGPIASLPGSTWTFETTAALVAIALDDRRTGGSRAAPLLEAHERWLEAQGLEAGSGLPVALVSRRGRAVGPARGCDLSFRVALLAHADRPRAEALYRRYAAARWVDRGALAGFAEWGTGAEGRPDADSGPVVLGIGGAATALGLAAMLAVGDEERLLRMDGLATSSRQLLPLVLAGGPVAALDRAAEPPAAGVVPLVTGSLCADATLFYALSWHSLPGEPPAR